MTFMAILQSGINELLEYLSAHVLTCLVPAFFIAGGIAAVVSTGAVLKYFGPRAPKHLAYGVASVSGAILAVCSCTVLPLFAGIHKKGAGLGPAVTFLFSGPAINILAIVLTARKMGWELGLARAIGAISFSIIIGLLMAFIFRKEEVAGSDDGGMFAGEEGKPVGHLLAFFGTLVAILLFGTAAIPFWSKIAIIFSLLSFLAVVLTQWFDGDEVKEWLVETWKFVKLIFPILLVGVFVAGILKAVIPQHWIEVSVGGNGLSANLLASVFGALMYFSTLTEVPIVKAFLDMGMGKGPALALLLAGPSLSLPNMLVLRNVMGTKRTIVYVLIVVVLSTLTGMVFGSIVG
ncbi:permease [Desulfallas sp. Bu1-1]|uniref:permease n=1 Tax=Desulfallas sp. Bu1-1 TaxID=2787620 RepID=UPI00189D3521|nr:permease [Desulfallas sp. Bu1-1]MBF7082881.1 permease [Desulfallas sp. Bu1-1]